MKIGIIGCGHMGSSLAKQLSKSHQVSVYDRYPEKITLHRDFPQIKICRDPQEAMKEAELILLFFKPHDLQNAATQLKPHLHPHQILISGLAGTSLTQLIKTFGDKHLIVRIMPNLAVEYGLGVTGFAESPRIDLELKQRLSSAFDPLGLNLWLPEHKLDALTAIASSGLAFNLIFIEAMIDAAIALGFTSDDARQIVTRTLAGTLSMLEATGKHPGELRWQVSSPGGTTIAGTIALEEANVRAGIIKTLLAAHHRAEKLASDYTETT